MKTKTSSVRLPKEMYEKIDTVCDDVGCSRNDWIKDAVETKLFEESSENIQDQEDIKVTLLPQSNHEESERLLKSEGKIISINGMPVKVWKNVRLVSNET